MTCDHMAEIPATSIMRWASKRLDERYEFLHGRAGHEVVIEDPLKCRLAPLAQRWRVHAKQRMHVGGSLIELVVDQHLTIHRVEESLLAGRVVWRDEPGFTELVLLRMAAVPRSASPLGSPDAGSMQIGVVQRELRELLLRAEMLDVAVLLVDRAPALAADMRLLVQQRLEQRVFGRTRQGSVARRPIVVRLRLPRLKGRRGRLLDEIPHRPIVLLRRRSALAPSSSRSSGASLSSA